LARRRIDERIAFPDHLIQSVFDIHQARTVAIVLSGALPAGIKGLRAVNAGGGITMAQDAETAGNFGQVSAGRRHLNAWRSQRFSKTAFPAMQRFGRFRSEGGIRPIY
jgi:hypothetical protein